MSAAQGSSKGPPSPPPTPTPTPSLFSGDDPQSHSPHITVGETTCRRPRAQPVEVDEELILRDIGLLTYLEAQTLSGQNSMGKLGAILVTTNVQPILQIGPICGLVALAMGAQHLDPSTSNPNVHVHSILEQAQRRGFTKSGEMFSVVNMMNLANDLFGYRSSLMDTRVETRHTILGNLLDGNLILIPYDADGNHGPCQRKGHSAHWALLTGFALFVNLAQLESVPGSSGGLGLLYLDPQQTDELGKDALLDLLHTLPDQMVYVTARQGKSAQVGLWNYQRLIQSNQNLVEISPKILAQPEDFITFPIESSLCILNPPLTNRI